MKIKIKWKIVVVLAILFVAVSYKTGAAQQKFDKAAFYDVMSSGDADAINNEIAIVKDAQPNNKEGYEGALLMKKASFPGPPSKKLKVFKEGRIKLESALLADNDNTEYHFLRLAIEENAPKIVKYHADIEKDKLFVQKNFKDLHPSVQHAILDYCKKSKVLRAEDFSPRSKESS